ncbi:MAG: helix-turn-helix transcriptional regulator [Tissierellia bacterium]|nr:helix-turn-helix transcriptional regulator [Tissierellia bacterium]
MKNNLERLRKEKGLSQEALASILSVSRQTVSSIETGKYNPSLELAFKIAGYFKTSIENIFEYKEEN